MRALLEKVKFDAMILAAKTQPTRIVNKWFVFYGVPIIM